MIKNKLLASPLKMRKTFDSPLANHFSPVTQALKTMKRLADELIPESAENRNTDLPPRHVPHLELEFCNVEGSPKTGPPVGLVF
jgi:hypothetical protein